MADSCSFVQVKKRTNCFIFLFCLILSAVIIGICSRSSPLYPFNNWDDCNCFFTVGKALAGGKVLYRDIYEQKGPLLYFLYILVYRISSRSFLGAYLFETLFFSVFLYLAFDFSRNCFRLNFFTAAALIPLMSCFLCSSYSFYMGGSVEQLFIPMFFLPLYAAGKAYCSTGQFLPSGKMIVLLGVASAVLFWSKFTTIGIYIGYILFILIYCLNRKEYKKLFASAGFFLLGFALVTAPILLYFCVNHALGDLFEVYFYNNLFLYPGKNGKNLYIFCWYIYHAVLSNPALSIPIFLWIGHILFDKRKKPAFKVFTLCLYGVHLVVTYIGCTAFPYYAFALASLAVPGYCLAAKWLQDKLSKVTLSRPAGSLVCLASVMLSAVFAYVLSPNSFFMKYKDDELWFTSFASAIESSEDRSLFNYNCLDTGLYTLTGYLPENRFFCKLNIPLKEMEEEAEEVIQQQKVEWVVTHDCDSELLNDNYEMEMSVKDFKVIKDTHYDYYLYRRK